MSQFIEMFGDVIKNSNDWREYGPIGNYVDIVLGSTPDSKNPQYWDGDICWVTPAELNDDVVVINDTVRHITNDGVSAANLTKLPKGSVLFSTRAPIGKVAVTGVEMYCNQGFKNFICGDKLNNLYLYYTLKLNRDYLCALGTGTTFKELSKKVVESISIAIPPIEMQNKFEDVFKQADKSKFVGFKSQFIEMFFSGKYTAEKLREHIEVIRGVSYKPSDVCNAHSENASIILRSNNIDGGQINFDDLVFVDSERVSEQQVLNAGDIVMCGSNGSKKLVGKAAMLQKLPNERTSFGAFCLGIRCKSTLVSEYLATYFQTSLYREKIESLGSGSNILNIKPDHIYDLEIPIPSYEEQKAFVSIVKQADKSKYFS